MAREIFCDVRTAHRMTTIHVANKFVSCKQELGVAVFCPKCGAGFIRWNEVLFRKLQSGSSGKIRCIKCFRVLSVGLEKSASIVNLEHHRRLRNISAE